MVSGRKRNKENDREDKQTQTNFTHFLLGAVVKVYSLLSFLSNVRVASHSGLNLPAVPRLQSSETNSRLHMSNL
ncbi:Uncharacterized protein APZ42_019213 [Daphnia magna]|uniref:Uncharacterized protein n=1 Tax=Daphnia magna TaxID=35525 RepID=A0A162CNZ0_9CRUS|nr:Uncharacterized protein APZ42_019213 [Daphnia magna]